ncbi:MAG: succinate dehydrogenase cytochrome b subunit [Bacteroidales bacterium]|nr:succinate dehydrogenase cytochrome b subunit [Bacteroidales bacterium]
MPKLPKFLQFASITKKITLALIGLFLMLFLLTHLGINLCLLRNDGGEWFRAAAHFMGTNYIVKVFEVVLFGAIALHILLALTIQIHNWRARPVGYASGSKSKTAFGSKLMIWSGLLVALFLCIHLVNFWFAKVGWNEGRYLIKVSAIEKAYKVKQQALSDAFIKTETDEERMQIEADFVAFQDGLEFFQTNEKLSDALHGGFDYITDLSKAEIREITAVLPVKYEPDFYVMVRDLFQNKWIVLMYLFFLTALCFHLMHAFQSAFQTLGMAHSKYTPIIKVVGVIFALGVSVGFAIIPIFFYFCK